MTRPVEVPLYGPDGLIKRVQRRFALDGVCFGPTPLGKREDLGRWHADARVEHREVAGGRVVVTRSRRPVAHWRTVGALLATAISMGVVPRGARIVE